MLVRTLSKVELAGMSVIEMSDETITDSDNRPLLMTDGETEIQLSHNDFDAEFTAGTSELIIDLSDISDTI